MDLTERSGLYSLLDDANITVGTLIDRGRWALGKPSATYRKYHQATQRWLSERKVQEHRTVSTGDHIELDRDLRITLLRLGMGYLRNSTLLCRFRQKFLRVK